MPDLRVRVLSSDGAAPGPGVSTIRIDRRAPGRFASLEHDLRLPFDIRRHGRDVVHSPALDPPRRCDLPWVQTLHDVIPLVLDHAEYADARRRWLRFAPRFKEAAVVLCDSLYTADEGARVLELDRDRIRVAPLGVDGAFRTPIRRTRTDPPSLLFVGELDPRKGHREALAVASALATLGYPHRLRIVGRIAPWVRAALERLVVESERPDRIDLVGYVDDLASEYDRSDVLLFTSRYEGFGLPALEAMARGTPVVAFRNSSVPEVVGEAGLLVEDGDVPAFTAAVRHVLDEPELWRELSALGQERAARFTWDEAVECHHAAYVDAVERS